MTNSHSVVLSDLLSPATVKLDLQSSDRHEVLAELVNQIPQLAKEPAARQTLLRALHERERLHSTGIGDGIALHHARNALCCARLRFSGLGLPPAYGIRPSDFNHVRCPELPGQLQPLRNQIRRDHLHAAQCQRQSRRFTHQPGVVALMAMISANQIIFRVLVEQHQPAIL